MKRNILAYFSYPGSFFSHSYEINPAIQQIDSINKQSTVESCLKKTLIAVTGGKFNLDSDIDANIGVFTTSGANAISNTASIK